MNAARNSKQDSVRTGDDPARWRDEAYPTDYQDQVNRAIGFIGASHDFFVVGKARWLQRFLEHNGIDGSKASLLDIGCGIGLLHPYLIPMVGRLSGIDLSATALIEARARNPQVHYEAYEGSRLPFEDAQFDLALAVTVMHHVPVAQWPLFVSEAKRVLKPGGVFIVIEHNPLNPATLYSVKKSELDTDAVLLRAGKTMGLMRDAGLRRVGQDYIFFTPFERTQLIDRSLSWLPLGAQYAAYGFRD